MLIKKAAVIVAGGKGLRMQAGIPKQFIEIAGMPVLMHTISNFYRFDNAMHLVLVLPEAHFRFWNELCEKFEFKIKHTIVAGGENRFHSVLNGLQQVSDASLVAIHDGVRPLVSHDAIARCFDAALREGAAIPVTECVESIRCVNDGSSNAVDRSKFRLVQTPQVFEKDLLFKAYQQPFSPLFTDDASVVESYFASQCELADRQIALVEGNRENIKITTRFDLIVAEAILGNEH